MSPDPALGGLLASGLVIRPGAEPVDERIRPGGIVGLAGLDGHGQAAFLRMLAGLLRPVSGQVMIGSAQGWTPLGGFRQAVRQGIAYLARDRRAQGIFPALSILDNFAMTSLDRDIRYGLIDPARREARFRHWQARLEIVAADPRAPITSLSGGNQQKVLLARWLALEPRILLLDDPTRGVDQRTRDVLYRIFIDLAGEGMAVLILSSEIEEVLRLCERVLVFREGSIAARLDTSRLSHGHVMAAMFGQPA